MPGKSLEEGDFRVCAQEPIHIPNSVDHVESFWLIENPLWS
jgi:hypothetical protein